MVRPTRAISESQSQNYIMKEEIERYFDRLWPLNRSLTGNGNRETLKILSELIDLQITEVPSGTECFDWTVPPEWNVKEAWIKDSKGNKIVDFSKNNLHLLGYSIPVNRKMLLSELKENIYTLPDQPFLIPYFTSYYKERWGFCMTHNQFTSLQEVEYEVFVDSYLDYKGFMTIGEVVLNGSSDREILISTNICHPSMANDQLSGPLVSAFIYRELKKMPNRFYTYRFVFIPGTIGSIYYLSKHGKHLKQQLDAGFNIVCIGDPGNFTYKRSRQSNSLADRCAEIVLKQTEEKFIIEDFSPGGHDERQYCSPGFNLPVGSLMRTRYGKYAEYHTSADNKDFISFDSMEKSIFKYLEILNVLENNFHYINTMPYGEPQLGKRGLYPTVGSQVEIRRAVDTMMWILSLADGTNDLIGISEKSKIPLRTLIPVVNKLIESGIVKR
jgi:aminopeptidase-like protein